jgi:hypothetical protein
MKMGIIAEDDSDVVVIRAFTLSLLGHRRIGFKRFVGHGGGRVRRKCSAWAQNLVRQGCSWVVVLHDLDDREEAQFRAELERAIATVKAEAKVVLLPKREIEAWLLYDSAAIAAVFNSSKHPRLPGNPEALPDPKDHLANIVWRYFQRDYINTSHNEAIATQVDTNLLKRSHSFSPHFPFVECVQRALRNSRQANLRKSVGGDR